jgi:predicted nucleic acid-binding protein
MIFLLDTNAVSDWLSPVPHVIAGRIEQRLKQGERVAICQPVYYELARGLLWRQATSKLTLFREKILPQLEYVSLEESDWQQAAQFWAETRQQGRQLSDIDLLIAAVAFRLDAVIISRDADFDALSVKRENWAI